MKRTRHYEPAFLDVYQVAARYGLKHSTIWTWVREGKEGFPPPIRFTASVSRWSLDDLRSWEQQKRAEAATRPEWEERQRRKQMKQAREAGHGR